MQSTIAKLIRRENLSPDEMAAAFELVMTGQATEAQIGGFLAALAAKGETVEEIAAAARVMRSKMTPIALPTTPTSPPGRIVLDTCGTGGDRLNTFNISTAAAIIAAAAGVTVAKHGNRAATGTSGSAEVLAELGVNVSAPANIVQRCMDQAGIGFCFAPLLHGAMKFAAPVRKQLGVRTIFNILGPLTNPASARRQVLGVFADELTVTLARVLGELGSERAAVVHGRDGLDEVSLTGPTHVAELVAGAVREYELTPGDFGLSAIRLADIQVRSPAQSAAMIHDVLAGKPGPAADIACANAALACVIADRAADVVAGLKLCRDAIASGTAARTLEQLVRISNEKT
jgi:anthranilate phosphoribosyltransferase